MRMSSTLQKMPPMPSKSSLYRSVKIEASGKAFVRTSSLPEPEDDEVRVELEGSGVRTSGISKWGGRTGVQVGNVGHEGWGIIDAVGKDVKGLYVRERVTGLMNDTYATHAITHPDMLVKLPDFLDDKPFPGEPLGYAMNVFTKSNIQNSSTVAIIGCGFLGLLLVQLAKNQGAKVIAISKRKYSLQLAGSYEADHLIEMGDDDKIIGNVRELTSGKFCERVIDCSERESVSNLSARITARNGRLIVAGLHQNERRIHALLAHARRANRVEVYEQNPNCRIKGIKKAINAVQIGILDPFPLFTHTFSLEEMGKTYQNLVQRPNGFIKALVLIRGSI